MGQYKPAVGYAQEQGIARRGALPQPQKGPSEQGIPDEGVELGEGIAPHVDIYHVEGGIDVGHCGQ